MVTKVTIDSRRANKEGKYPVKLRFFEDGKCTYYRLGIWANIEDMNDSGFLSSSDKNRKREISNMNAIIMIESERARAIQEAYRREGKHLSSAQMKSEMTAKPEKENEEITFNEYFWKFARGKNGRTAEIYELTIKKIESMYLGKLYFPDINYSWLIEFEKRMRISINAKAIHLRNIRAVFNDAINNDVIGLNHYPFRKFKIKHEKTRKRAITVEQLRAIFDHSGTEGENWSVDMAKLIFFLIGINAKDLHTLSMYDGRYVEYRRAKTGALYSVKVEPEAKLLLEKYKGDAGSLLMFEKQFILTHSFYSKINDYLKSISEKLNITPHVTTYSIRHTWATIASELDIPKETIAAALGHSGGSVTDVYIDFNHKKVDAANRKVIDYVLYSRE